MSTDGWNGVLRFSLIFCPIRLLPCAKASGEAFGVASSSFEKVANIECFISYNKVDQTARDMSYYLYPRGNLEGELSADTLHALRVGMLRSECSAIGSMKVGSRNLPILVEPYKGGLLMSTLHPEEERYPSEFIERAENLVSSDMIEIAEDIIRRLNRDLHDAPSGSHQADVPETRPGREGHRITFSSAPCNYFS